MIYQLPTGAGSIIAGSRAARVVHGIQTASHLVNAGQGIYQAGQELRQGNDGAAAFYSLTSALGFMGASRSIAHGFGYEFRPMRGTANSGVPIALERIRGYGLQNNIKGAAFENLVESKFQRLERSAFFRSRRRGGFDLVSLEGRQVVINEAKFANNLQFDDFTAITRNLRRNSREVLRGLRGNAALSREEKALVRHTLNQFLEGQSPENLSIRIVTGKGTIGSLLRERIRESAGLGVSVESFR